MANDPRIGHKTTNGTKWPEQTLGGASFIKTEQPPTKIFLSKTQFVVLDTFPQYDREAKLKEVRDSLRSEVTRVPEVKRESKVTGE